MSSVNSSKEISMIQNRLQTADLPAGQSRRDTPLFVKLGGSLIQTDTLHESLVLLPRQRPSDVWPLPVWRLREGCRGLKARLASPSHA